VFHLQLAKAGARTVVPSTGQSALHIVLDNMGPDQQMLDFLLHHGACPYIPDKSGGDQSPLQNSLQAKFRSCHNEMVKSVLMTWILLRQVAQQWSMHWSEEPVLMATTEQQITWGDAS